MGMQHQSLRGASAVMLIVQCAVVAAWWNDSTGKMLHCTGGCSRSFHAFCGNHDAGVDDCNWTCGLCRGDDKAVCVLFVTMNGSLTTGAARTTLGRCWVAMSVIVGSINSAMSSKCGLSIYATRSGYVVAVSQASSHKQGGRAQKIPLRLVQSQSG